MRQIDIVRSGIFMEDIISLKAKVSKDGCQEVDRQRLSNLQTMCPRTTRWCASFPGVSCTTTIAM